MRKAESAGEFQIAPAPGEIEKMPIQLCLFDLDDTLLHTSDLEPFRGRQNCGQPSKGLIAELKLACMKNTTRMYYSEEHLTSMREQHPYMKWGVFTRAVSLRRKTGFTPFDNGAMVASP